MKILVIGKEGRLQKNTDPSIYGAHEIAYIPMGKADEEVVQTAPDAEIILVDAMGSVSKGVIDGLSKLKMIHSEGVGYQWVDTKAAADRGIYVCNCKGMNASAVAEQTILLMLGLLRDVVGGDRGVREARQIQIKEQYMLQGNLRELADCTIGLIGFGDIAKSTAKMAGVFGAKLVYYSRTRASEAVEKEYGVTYMELDELLQVSDMVSLHVPVTEKTLHMADAAFFEKMKRDAYLINTSRGELVDAKALLEAIKQGKLAGAGLDCIEAEPVQPDNPMLQADEETAAKILYSCHIGGITHSSFVRGYRMFWENVARIADGEKPERIVNGI